MRPYIGTSISAPILESHGCIWLQGRLFLWDPVAMAPTILHVHGGELPANSGIQRERRELHRLLHGSLRRVLPPWECTHAESSGGNFLRDF